MSYKLTMPVIHHKDRILNVVILIAFLLFVYSVVGMFSSQKEISAQPEATQLSTTPLQPLEVSVLPVFEPLESVPVPQSPQTQPVSSAVQSGSVPSVSVPAQSEEGNSAPDTTSSSTPHRSAHKPKNSLRTILGTLLDS